MLRKIVTVVVLGSLATLIVLFAVANRAGVVISFDPFAADAPAFALAAPLFVALLVVLVGGVIVGGIAAWLNQAKWRRRARRLARDLARARAETEDLQRRLEAAPPQPPAATLASI